MKAHRVLRLPLLLPLLGTVFLWILNWVCLLTFEVSNTHYMHNQFNTGCYQSYIMSSSEVSSLNLSLQLLLTNFMAGRGRTPRRGTTRKRRFKDLESITSPSPENPVADEGPSVRRARVSQKVHSIINISSRWVFVLWL